MFIPAAPRAFPAVLSVWALEARAQFIVPAMEGWTDVTQEIRAKRPLDADFGRICRLIEAGHGIA
jgi:hypothetical protein